MKILMVCSTYPGAGKPRCGIGEYTHKLVTSLRSEHVSVEILPGDRVDETLRFGRENACDLVHWQYHPRTYGPQLRNYRLGLVSRTRRNRLPLLVTMHTIRDQGKGSFARSFLARAGADHVIFTNHHDARAWAFPLLLPPGKRTICPVGPTVVVSPSSHRDPRAELGLSAQTFLLSTFGFLNRGKGLPLLFQAMTRLKMSLDQVCLAIVGEVRPEAAALEKELKTLAHRLNLQDSIRWLGELPDEGVSRLLAASDLYVLPYSEGASTKRTTLMTGLAHGSVIVTTESRDRFFPLQNGVHLECVPRQDPEALAQRILDLYACPGHRKALATAALKMAPLFSWETIGQTHLQLYRRFFEGISARNQEDPCPSSGES